MKLKFHRVNLKVRDAQSESQSGMCSRIACGGASVLACHVNGHIVWLVTYSVFIAFMYCGHQHGA